MKVGDKVRYVPHSIHALHKDIAGDYPWHIGRKRVVRQPTTEGIENVEVVEKLEGKALDVFLADIKRAPDRKEAMKKLCLIAPKQVWPAVVTAVNADGTVALDVQANRSGITLHEPRVSVNQAEALPHSCHSVPIPLTGGTK